MPQFKPAVRLALLDALLILLMAVLAACGLVYEYLLSHYAGRVLGAVEHAIFATIGLMIVAMGFGSFAARKIQHAITGFAWLEVLIGLIGSVAIIFIATCISFSFYLPQIIADTFAIPPDALPRGGFFEASFQFARNLPYVLAAILGFFIGMEIPLIARVREELHQQHLTHNAGTIYGADYIGAGIGAAIWILWLMTIDISQAAVITASVNWVAGLVVLVVFWSKIKAKMTLAGLHLLMLLAIIVLSFFGKQWMHNLTDMLYRDNVVFQTQSKYQQLVLTERNLGPNFDSIVNLYLNGRLQFSSQDEAIYHEFLVHPVLSASARQEKVLVIGGGDSLAVREILKWQPKRIDLVDLDNSVIELFKQPETLLSPRLADKISGLTQGAFQHESLNIINADAFNQVDTLISQQQTYDAIIVDLPDPNHPDLNKLYTNYFYLRLNQLLSADGAIVVQSTSPYHAKDAFISIGKTLADSQFSQVEQYHFNVPSFGEWGWTIATKQGMPASQRIKTAELPGSLTWLTHDLIHASFQFPKNYYQDYADIKINYLGSQVLYQYHDQAWRIREGKLVELTQDKN